MVHHLPPSLGMNIVISGLDLKRRNTGDRYGHNHVKNTNSFFLFEVQYVCVRVSERETVQLSHLLTLYIYLKEKYHN